MKGKKIIFIILLTILIVLWIVLSLNYLTKDRNSQNESDTLSPEEKQEVIEDITNDISEDTVVDDNDSQGIKDSENSEKNEKNEKNDNDKKYDQYLVASGYSGASDNVYYTKDGVLYHLVLSANKITKVAEGVSKIEGGKGTIEVYKNDNFKMFEEDNYLTYVD